MNPNTIVGNGGFMELNALGRYEIRGELGRGTMGIVYRGYDPMIDRPVALKTVLLPSFYSAEQRKAFLQRFFLEARIAGKLIHPNIVVTYDAATDEPTQTPFIVMELVEGEPLSERIRGQKRLGWRQAIGIVVPVARALDYAHHQHGIVHRDIKPANLLLTRAGVPKITDFGIAKLPKADLTQSGVVMGTPYYMSPEQVLGEKKLDGRSDLFSLGSVLYTLLVGTPPFEAAELAAISHQILYKDPIPPSEIVSETPAALDGVLARALTKRAGDRYPTGQAFLEDLLFVEKGERPRLALKPAERTRAPENDAASQPLDSTLRQPSCEPGAPATQGRLPRARSSIRWLMFASLLVGGLAYGVRLGPGYWEQKTALWSESFRGLSAWVGGGWEGLREAYRRSGAEREELNRLRTAARAFLEQGEQLEEKGHWAQARAVYQASLDTYRQADDGRGEASVLAARGRLEAETGNWSRARGDLEAAGAVYRIYDHPAGEIESLLSLGNLERDRGNGTRAEALYRQVLDRAEKLKNLELRNEALLNQAILDLLGRRWELARKHLDTVLRTAPAGEGDERSKALSWLGASSFVTAGSRDAASTLWADARRSCKGNEASVCSAEIRLWEGGAALHERDLVEARSCFEEAERIFRLSQHRPGLIASLEGLVELAEGGEEVATSQERLEEISELSAQLGLSEWKAGSESARHTGKDGDPQLERLAALLEALPRTPLGEERLAHWGRVSMSP